jgi:SAM-dependent methyltransferase
VDGYGPSTYGDRFADVYDEWYGEVSDAEATVARVVDLATRAAPDLRPPRVLELGAGSGRLAVPLAARGLDVWAVDASAAMLDRLRAKPGAGRVHAVLDDMATLGAPELTETASGAAPFDVVLCAFNTLFNLTDTAAQAHCLGRVAALLAPDGRFVVEAFVPPPDDAGGAAGDAAGGASGGVAGLVGTVEARHIGLDEVVLTVSRVDPATRTVVGQHVQITEAGIRLSPWVLHYQSPTELDDLAAAGGLRLVERRGGWRDEPFTPMSGVHVSVYAPAHAGPEVAPDAGPDAAPDTGPGGGAE